MLGAVVYGYGCWAFDPDMQYMDWGGELRYSVTGSPLSNVQVGVSAIVDRVRLITEICGYSDQMSLILTGG
jgi:hypothetical protein